MKAEERMGIKPFLFFIVIQALFFGCGVSVEHENPDNHLIGKRIIFQTEMTYITGIDKKTSIIDENKYDLHLYRKNDAIDIFEKFDILIDKEEIFIVVDSFTVNPTGFNNLFWSSYRQLILEDSKKNKSIFPASLVKQNEWK
jgi:hypothetical protein